MASVHERERKVSPVKGPRRRMVLRQEEELGGLGWEDGRSRNRDQELSSVRFSVRMRKLSAASNNHNNNNEITCKTVMVFLFVVAGAATEVAAANAAAAAAAAVEQ